MNLSFDFLPEALTQALGWALLHSLWQGALAGLTLALLLILLNRHSARLRYTVSMLGLSAVPVMFVVTFMRLYTATETGTMPAEALEVYGTQLGTASPTAAALPLWEQALVLGKEYFAVHLPLLVSLWLLGLLVMALRFLGGLAYVQRLRHYKAQALGQHWQQTLEHVKQSMGLQRSVQLLESALVQAPLAIGYFKPIILFPIGAVTGLSQRQVEAVLAHELAHVLRHDYLLNIMQQLVEALFFFHPAVWWMSAMARTEREHCCDDLAVRACGDRLTYARALAQLESMRMPAAPAYAMALTGNKGSLLSRVKRLVSNADLRPSFGEGFMAALVVMGGLMLLSFGAWAGLKKPYHPKEEISYDIPVVPAPASPAAVPAEPEEEALSATTITLQDTAGRTSDVIIIKNKKGEIAELYVNGRRIPKKDIPKFQQLIDQRLQASRRAPRMKRSERDRMLRETEEAVAGAGRRGNTYNYTYTYTGPDSMRFEMTVPPAPPAPPAPGVAPMPPMPPMPPAPPAAPFTFGETDKKKNKEAEERYKEEMKKYEQEMAKYAAQMERYAHDAEARAARQAEAGARNHDAAMRRHELAMRRHEANMKRHEAHMRRHEDNMRNHEERRAMMERVQQEMVKDGLLKEGERVTDFSINKDGFYVNGQKQSEALHKKYRELMKTKDGKHINMNFKRDGEHVQIQSSQQ